MIDPEVYVVCVDRRWMEQIIDHLEPGEISDALGLLRLFARIGQITPDELTALRRRVEGRAGSFRKRRHATLAIHD